MSKKPATTVVEREEIIKLLRRGRSRYDNAILEIERVWAKLKPSDYKKRAKLIRSATSLLEIDRNLRVWEDKLNRET